MISAEAISMIFGASAGIWALGFAWGKVTAWIRALKNAA